MQLSYHAIREYVIVVQCYPIMLQLSYHAIREYVIVVQCVQLSYHAAVILSCRICYRRAVLSYHAAVILSCNRIMQYEYVIDREYAVCAIREDNMQYVNMLSSYHAIREYAVCAVCVQCVCVCVLCNT